MLATKVKRTHYEVQSGVKKRKDKKTGKTIETPQFERFNLMTPVGYDMADLKAKLKPLVRAIVNGERKEVEVVLERFPQVGTVMGQLRAEFGKTFTFGYTTKEEGNTLFRISRVRKK